MSNAMDNGPNAPNPGQADEDMDGYGDICDPCLMDPLNTCCSANDIRISEVFGGTPDYVEVINTGSCDWDIGGMQLAWILDCDTAPVTFTFPVNTIVPAGTVFRAVETTACSLPNEVCTGVNICHNWYGDAWVALCDGPCDLGACSNFVDYMEALGNTTPPVNPPMCASFLPSPVDMSLAGTTDSATRVGFMGGGISGLLSDWVMAPFSRD